MAKEASFREAYKIGLESTLNDNVTLPLVYVSSSGRGKGELMNLLRDSLSSKQARVYTVKSPRIYEMRAYEPLLLLLDQITGSTTVTTDEEEIIGIFKKSVSDGERHVIIVESLNNMAQISFGLFLRIIVELSGLSNVKFIATAFEDEAIKDNLVLQLEALNSLEIVRIMHPDQDDMEFILKEWGYKLPDEVVVTLYQMTDANIAQVRYSLLYYESIGYIDARKTMSEVMLRYIPVPPTMDAFYETMVTSLAPDEIEILYLILTMDGRVKEDQLGTYTEIPQERISQIVTKQIKRRMISDIGNYLSISSLQFMDFLSNSQHNVVLDKIAETIVRHKRFEDLPSAMALMLLVRSGDADRLISYLNSKGEKILSGLSSYDFFLRYLDSGLKMIGPEGETVIRPLICKAYYLSGRLHESIDCLDLYFKRHPKTNDLILLEANCMLLLGDTKGPMKIIEEIEKSAQESEELKLKTLILKGNVQLASLDYSSAENTFKSVLEIASEAKDLGSAASALLSLGNLSLSRFSLDEGERNLNKALEYARSSGSQEIQLKVLNNLAVLNDYRGNYVKSVELYKKVLDLSIHTGDLRARAYATFNLFETSENIGEMWNCRNYIDVEEKLVKLVGDGRISYFFNRSAARFYVLEMEMDKALVYSGRALTFAEESGNLQWIEIAKGLNGVIHGLSGETIDSEITNFLLKEYQEPEDFLSYYYIIAGLYFEVIGDKEKRNKALSNMDRFSENVKEYFARHASLFVQTLTKVAENEPLKGIEIFKGAFEEDTGIVVINMIKELIEGYEKIGFAQMNDFRKHTKFIIEKYKNRVSQIFILLVLYLELSVLRVTGYDEALTEDLESIEAMHLPSRVMDRVRSDSGIVK